MWPKEIKFFKETENWGNPAKMSLELLKKVDDFRARVGFPMHITCGTQGVHEENSLHYVGKACDLIVLSNQTPTLDLIFKAVQTGFSGIGFYTDWQYLGTVFPGFHLEFEKDTTHTKLWVGSKNKKDPKKNDYSGMLLSNFRRLGIL